MLSRKQRAARSGPCRIGAQMTLAILLAIVTTSYFEKPQVKLLAPLKDRATLASESGPPRDHVLARQYGLPLKASSDGYYLNPHQLTSLVYVPAVAVLRSKDCTNLSADTRNDLLRVSLALRTLAKPAAGGAMIWPYPIHFSYGMRPGWLSAMAQARAAVVLYAASLCTAEQAGAQIDRRVALSALQPFYKNVTEGGVAVRLDAGHSLWFEEYAQPDAAPPRVLNGHIYALLALREMQRVVPSESLAALIDLGIEALRRNLHHYDITLWSMYDRVGTVANSSYQSVHIRQLGELADWLEEPAFARYQRKFQLQRALPFSSLVRLWLMPTPFLAFLLALDAALLFAVLYALCACRRPKQLRSLE